MPTYCTIVRIAFTLLTETRVSSFRLAHLQDWFCCWQHLCRFYLLSPRLVSLFFSVLSLTKPRTVLNFLWRSFCLEALLIERFTWMFCFYYMSSLFFSFFSFEWISFNKNNSVRFQCMRISSSDFALFFFWISL